MTREMWEERRIYVVRAFSDGVSGLVRIGYLWILQEHRDSLCDCVRSVASSLVETIRRICTKSKR